ncbi:hypothetical protein ABFW00_06705 [Mycobacteroides abscessus]|uniref:hypothetical protein n=1 Tax=Mycobacteroides abscessus TaxID=36809 RepID=UPI0034CFC969
MPTTIYPTIHGDDRSLEAIIASFTVNATLRSYLEDFLPGRRDFNRPSHLVKLDDGWILALYVDTADDTGYLKFDCSGGSHEFIDAYKAHALTGRWL